MAFYFLDDLAFPGTSMTDEFPAIVCAFSFVFLAGLRFQFPDVDWEFS